MVTRVLRLKMAVCVVFSGPLSSGGFHSLRQLMISNQKIKNSDLTYPCSLYCGSRLGSFSPCTLILTEM
jgi:hypothetical protein